MSGTDDLVTYADSEPLIDGSDRACAPAELPWTVLIVDDDADVHQVTRFSLAGVDFLGRRLAFLSAYSAAQAVEILGQEPDVAVILLDVVMESDHAGLDLVGRIRNELKLHKPRIILRTGQPGYAPEITAVRDYDINDYKTKSELTRTKLFTTVMSAVRAYDQICRIEAGRQGLELMVQASGRLLQEQGLREFATGVVTQLAALIGTARDGLVCALHNSPSEDEPESFTIIGAAGRFEYLIHKPIQDVSDARIASGLMRCLRERRNIIEADHVVIYIPSEGGDPFATFVDGPLRLRDVDERLLGVFCANVALCAKNINLVNQLKDFAFFDSLVQLPNRTAFVERLNRSLSDEQCREHAVAMIDIDQFGELNNAFGHAHADRLLKAVARSLLQGLGELAYVARLGGDTFAVLGHRSVVTSQRLRPMLSKAFPIGGVEQTIHVGIGYVMLADSSGSAQDVLKDAAIALKLGKKGGLDSDMVFLPSQGTEALERTRLLGDLKQAFGSQRLYPMFQPQIDLATGRVLGFEALMRWRADDGSMIAPDRFIPLAESSGLIVALGNWMLRSSLRAARQLHDSGQRDLRMAVNVSVVQFRDPMFLKVVEQAIADCGVPASMLELEITESVAMIGSEFVRETLLALRKLGVAIAIDDFGTGYSSLSYLEQLPLDRLKIDRAFVASLESDSGGGRIAPLVIELGRKLGLRVIAEGIEHESQRERLHALGCHEGQGYLISRPLMLDDMRAWLEGWNRNQAGRP